VLSGRATVWIIHQAWFNCVGAASGWASCWCLICRSEPLDAWSMALFLVAVIGITGYLRRRWSAWCKFPGVVRKIVVSRMTEQAIRPKG